MLLRVVATTIVSSSPTSIARSLFAIEINIFHSPATGRRGKRKRWRGCACRDLRGAAERCFVGVPRVTPIISRAYNTDRNERPRLVRAGDHFGAKRNYKTSDPLAGQRQRLRQRTRGSDKNLREVARRTGSERKREKERRRAGGTMNLKHVESFASRNTRSRWLRYVAMLVIEYRELKRMRSPDIKNTAR